MTRQELAALLKDIETEIADLRAGNCCVRHSGKRGDIAALLVERAYVRAQKRSADAPLSEELKQIDAEIASLQRRIRRAHRKEETTRLTDEISVLMMRKHRLKQARQAQRLRDEPPHQGVEEDKSVRLEDVIDDFMMQGASEEIIKVNLRDETAHVLSALTPEERKTIIERFGLEVDSEQVPEELGQDFPVTRERIRPVEAKALRKLRNPSRRLRAAASYQPEECGTPQGEAYRQVCHSGPAPHGSGQATAPYRAGADASAASSEGSTSEGSTSEAAASDCARRGPGPVRPPLRPTTPQPGKETQPN